MNATENDVMVIINKMLLLDQRNISCNETINRMIRNRFGTSALTISDVWNRIVDTCTLPDKARLKHLLWMFLYFKTYSEYEVYTTLYNTSKPNFISWVWYFAKCVAELDVVSYLCKMDFLTIHNCTYVPFFCTVGRFG
jgi:hypothetical protein